MFVDSDDYIDKNAVKILLDKIVKDNLYLVVCDYYKVKNEKMDRIENNPNLLLNINLSP